MKVVEVLSEEYREFYSIDLQKNKKMSLIVNLLAVAITVFMLVPMLFLVPISSLFSMDKGFLNYIVRFVSLIVLMVLYMVLHELTHGVAMKICGTKKVKYGFTGLYAFAGSNDYYDKKSYFFIALAPVILWGFVIAIINCFVSIEWFWVVYILQIINLSGAAGDLFIIIKFSRFPKDILIRDCGVNMTVYFKE
ncbi:MAG: DUF3267 domain-containing protein [Acutalibacteraceae bacterium]|nr:DUF3267 domain-containing protein [Acutalibacteraceae bacterium]